MSLNINWDEVIKKEARGINDYDLGEVHAVEADTVVTKKGMLDKDKFYLPKNLAEAFDGNKLIFKITKEDAQTYRFGIFSWIIYSRTACNHVSR